MLSRTRRSHCVGKPINIVNLAKCSDSSSGSVLETMQCPARLTLKDDSKMLRRLFDRIMRALKGKRGFKKGFKDALGKKDVHSKIKLISVLFVFGYVISFEFVYKTCKIGKFATGKKTSGFLNIGKKHSTLGVFLNPIQMIYDKYLKYMKVRTQ